MFSDGKRKFSDKQAFKIYLDRKSFDRYLRNLNVTPACTNCPREQNPDNLL